MSKPEQNKGGGKREPARPNGHGQDSGRREPVYGNVRKSDPSPVTVSQSVPVPPKKTK